MSTGTKPRLRVVTQLGGPGAGPALAEGLLFVGRYRLESWLGRGGMGEVWVAADEELQRKVAVKFLHPRLARDKKAGARFGREMAALAQLEHPNIVRLYAFGVEPQPYIVMELVQGVTLREMIRAVGRVGYVAAVCYAIRVADGLGAAHRVGISHRDIKPENVMVNDEGRVWLVDFGIALRAGERRRGGATTTDRMGTLAYMTPEAALSRPADHRGDFYSLGVVLYEMLTGRLPYGAVDPTSETGMQGAHAFSAPVPIPSLVPTCPPSLWEVVAKLLAKDPDLRHQNADALIADLLEILVRASNLPEPGAPLARAVAEDVVRQKLASRPPPPHDGEAEAAPSGAGDTAPMRPTVIPPRPCALPAEGVGPRDTLPFALPPGAAPPSPAASPMAGVVQLTAPTAAAPARETMPVGPVPGVCAPFPLPEPVVQAIGGGAAPRWHVIVVVAAVAATCAVGVVGVTRFWSARAAAPVPSATPVPSVDEPPPATAVDAPSANAVDTASASPVAAPVVPSAVPVAPTTTTPTAMPAARSKPAPPRPALAAPRTTGVPAVPTAAPATPAVPPTPPPKPADPETPRNPNRVF